MNISNSGQLYVTGPVLNKEKMVIAHVTDLDSIKSRNSPITRV